MGQSHSATKRALEEDQPSPATSTEETPRPTSAPSRPTYEWETIAGLRNLVLQRSASADAIRVLAEQACQGDFDIDYVAQTTPPLTELLCQERALQEALRVPFITSKDGRDDFGLAIELTHCLYETRKAALNNRKLARIGLQREAA